MADKQVDDLLNFDKKKKKKKTAVADGKPAEVEPEAEPVSTTEKKKKKVKETVEAPKGDEDVLELNLEGKKKKKKVVEEVDKLADDLNAELNFGTKKKKKVNIADVVVGDEKNASVIVDGDLKEGTIGDYTYEMLLKRVFDQIFTNNPELMSDQKRRLAILPPQLARVGTKKTSFVNFMHIARQLKRETAHLSSYMLTELGTAGSMDANGALLIRGRYQSKHIEPVLRNYCRNYVLCATCQSPDTQLSKDSRLLFMQCRRCGSRISVKTVQGGFQAVTAKRAAMRAKAQ